MKRLNWVLYGALSLGIGFLALHPGSVKSAKAQSESGGSGKRCDNATLHGTYESFIPDLPGRAAAPVASRLPG